MSWSLAGVAHAKDSYLLPWWTPTMIRNYDLHVIKTILTYLQTVIEYAIPYVELVLKRQLFNLHE